MEKVKLFDSIEEASTVIPVGEKKLVKVGETEICVVHQDAGFRAFANQCPHMSHPLNEGMLNPANEIVCPWHYHRFNLDTGNECHGRSGDLIFHEIVTSDSGEIFLMV